jgi:hypothetical protein
MTEEIIKDAKKHAFFIPPGQKAKLKSALARKRNKKKGRMRIPARLSKLLPKRTRLRPRSHLTNRLQTGREVDAPELSESVQTVVC